MTQDKSTQADKQAQAGQTNAVATTGEQQPAAPVENKQLAQAANKLETLTDVAKMVNQYGVRLVGKERALEFATYVSILAKQNPKILQCDPVSVLKGMMACVRLDMLPNTPEQYVALIPYGSELQFQVMYRGLAQLVYNTGVVNKIDAQLVFPADEWSIEEGTDRKLIHKWTAESLNIDRTKPDAALFVYATGIMNTGEKAFQIMTQSEVKEIREKAVKATKDDTPWKKWPASMYKKTVVKQFCKLLPKSSVDNRLAFALQADNLAEAGKLNLSEMGEIIEGETVDNTTKTRQRIAAAQAKRANMGGHKPKAIQSGEAPTDEQ